MSGPRDSASTRKASASSKARDASKHVSELAEPGSRASFASSARPKNAPFAHFESVASSSAMTTTLGKPATNTACSIQLRSMSATSIVANVAVMEAFRAKPYRRAASAALRRATRAPALVATSSAVGEETTASSAAGEETTASSASDASATAGVGTRDASPADAEDEPRAPTSLEPGDTAPCVPSRPRAKSAAAASATTAETRPARAHARRLRPIQ